MYCQYVSQASPMLCQSPQNLSLAIQSSVSNQALCRLGTPGRSSIDGLESVNSTFTVVHALPPSKNGVVGEP